MTSSVRRVVTGHDEKGKAIVLMDGEAGNVRIRQATGIGSTLLWVTDSTPPDISSVTDAAEREVGEDRIVAARSAAFLGVEQAGMRHSAGPRR